MPILRKEIMPVGSYLTRTANGRVKVPFSEPYLKELAETGNKMLASGIRIPVPFDHAKEAVPVELDKSPSSAYNNAGYWVRWSVEPNDEGKLTFVGFADIPGSQDDPESPYYKALHTAKDVSLSIHQKYTDGLGRVWNNAIIHGALVNHPVVPGQKDFEVAPAEGFVVNMSMLETDDGCDPGLIGQVRSALQEAFEMILPPSDDVKVFLRDLLVAASQVKAKRPSNGQQELEPVPIYMSTHGDSSMPLSKEQAEALVATKAINPSTTKPFTMEDLGFKPVTPPASVDLSSLQAQINDKDAKLSKAASIIQTLVSKLVSDTKQSIQTRINKLVEAGVISKDFAASQLSTKLDFQMSTLEDGSMAPHPLETTLSALEAIPQKQASGAPDLLGGGYIQPPPYSNASDLSAEDMNKAIAEFCQLV